MSSKSKEKNFNGLDTCLDSTLFGSYDASGSTGLCNARVVRGYYEIECY